MTIETLDLDAIRTSALAYQKQAENSSDDCLCHLDIEHLAGDVLALIKRLELVERALRVFGTHHPGCPVPERCTCGLWNVQNPGGTHND